MRAVDQVMLHLNLTGKIRINTFYNYFDIEVHLEVHLEAEADQDLQVLQVLPFQTVVSGPHHQQSLPSGQQPSKKFKCVG